MMFDLEKAIQRIGWRFTNSENKKGFKPNKNDIEAVNCLLNWINREKKVSLDNNELFAKLYIYHLNQTIRQYDATIFDDIPQKELSKILSTPLAYFYKAFQRELYSSHLLNISKQVQEGVEVSIEDLQEKYNEGVIEMKLNHMITEALNRFNV